MRRARCSVGKARSCTVIRQSKTTVMTVARQIAFMGSPFGWSFDPWLRERAPQPAIRQVYDVHTPHRVEVRAHDIGELIDKCARLPRIEIDADRLAGEVVEFRGDHRPNAIDHE